MKIHSLKIVNSTFLFFFVFTINLFAQNRSSFFEIDQYAGQKIPKSLLNEVSIFLINVPFEEALNVISEKGEFKLNYNRNRIPVKKPVSISMANVAALEALLHILEKTKTQLTITKEGNLAIVPLKNKGNIIGSIKGRIIDKETREPLFGTNISIVGMNMGGTSDKNGEFLINNIPIGNQTIQFSYIGYEIERKKNITIKENNETELFIELIPKILQLKEITVTPSQFSIMGEVPTVKQTMTHEDLQTATFGEDIYRAITRLPGISASDFSAKFTVRGGENEQILVLMDGLELYEPFHLKDIDGGALSIVDVDAIESIDLLTGGFPAEYGDRMSGVFNMRSSQLPIGKKRTSFGISLMNARFMTEGSFSNGRGSWLLSARRGYLDIVLDLMGEESPPKPKYYDTLGKLRFKLSEKHNLSVNFLHASDNMDFIEDDKDKDNTSYENTYSWLTLKSFPTSKLYVQSVASFGRIKHNRMGIGYSGDLKNIDFEVSDIKNVAMFGLKQDWNYELAERWYIKWGFDFKGVKSEYDYFSNERNVVYLANDQNYAWFDTSKADLNPSGNKFGIYLSNRLRVLSPLVAELGLRYDHNSYTKDELLSPRINLAYSIGKQTFIRGGWGYFYQSQGIHEINVPDGERGFYPAELAKHWVAGIEHTFGNGFNLRLESYYKDLSDLRSNFRNWSNDIEIFPELQNDRFKLNFRGAISKGLEFYTKYDRGGKFTCWGSYALASVKEDIKSLVINGIEYTEQNGYYPGRYNQRHTIYFDFNFRPNRNWHANLAWQYHSGWPYTELVMKSGISDGSRYYYTTYDEFHKAKFAPYHRLDFRINRYFYTSHGRISAFLALINVYNHGNEMDINYSWQSSYRGPYLEKQYEYWFKLLPTIGISWSWDH